MRPIVQRLVDHLNRHPEVKKDFQAAFKTALHAGIPLFKEFDIQTFDDYINWYNTLLTWTPSEDVNGKKIYNVFCLVSN